MKDTIDNVPLSRLFISVLHNASETITILISNMSICTETSSNEKETSIFDEIHHIWKDKVDYSMQKGVFFGLRSFIGKVCLQSRMYDAYRHPARQESKIMKVICQRTGATKLHKHQRFLPKLIMHKSLSVTAPMLYSLPLRSFGTSIHPRCDVIIVPKYHATLSMLRERGDLGLEDYRIILFQILYTLFELQNQYGFMHNDLHIQNILMKYSTQQPTRKKSIEYKVEETTYQVLDLEWTPILWDFEDARCHKLPSLKENQKTSNETDVPPQWCPYYDAHFLLISIIDVFAISSQSTIPLELRNWVLEMYPEDTIPIRVRNNSGIPSLEERRLHLAQYESKNLIGRLLAGQSLPDEIHKQLEFYFQKTWTEEELEESSMMSEDDDMDLERHYGTGDNYYDYLKSELPRDGITWDAEVQHLCMQAKTDVTMSESEYVVDNRITNSLPERSRLPTVKQLLQSSFFFPLRKMHDFETTEHHTSQ